MSKRNSRAAKTARRDERAQRDASRPDHDDELVHVQSYDELVGQAERGETLPCGCDAHDLLHSDGWQTL